MSSDRFVISPFARAALVQGALAWAVLAGAAAGALGNECFTEKLRQAFQGRAVEAPAGPELLVTRFSATVTSNAAGAIELARSASSGRPKVPSASLIKLRNLEHTYVAVFDRAQDMNQALGRVTTHQTEGRIISGRALTQANSAVQSFGGHDIPSHVARAYRRAFLRKGPPNDTESPRLRVEWDFWSQVMLPLLDRDPEAVIVAGALDLQPRAFLSHEILHAHFYEKPELQKVIGRFWDERLTATDRAKIIAALKAEKYDIDNREQVINEFFAYTLQDGKSHVLPPALVKKYRDQLAGAIRQAGIEIPG